jgi:AraC family transcriptional regulator
MEEHAMRTTAQQIGSWNGLILRQQTGGSSIGVHQHESHMLRLQTHGVSVSEWHNNSKPGRTIIEPGNLAILPAGAQHDRCIEKRREPGEEPRHMTALVTEKILKEAAEAASVKKGNIELGENRKFRDVQLERLLWALHETGAQNSPVSDLLGDTLSAAIAIHLIGNYASDHPLIVPHRGGIAGSRLARVLDYVEAHIHTSLPLSALADAAAMSPFHFSRAFRQSTGQSPHQYILVRRIEYAKSLLRSSELAIGEVSLSAGFGRHNHFAKVFRKKTGLTPTEFRRRL